MCSGSCIDLLHPHQSLRSWWGLGGNHGGHIMCELMGMSFAKPVVASVSIQAFSERSADNADGWGLAWYPDHSLAMIKQPVQWSVHHNKFLEHYPGLLSSMYVAHVRRKTTGHVLTHADT